MQNSLDANHRSQYNRKTRPVSSTNIHLHRQTNNGCENTEERRAHVLSFMNSKKPKTGDGNVSATMGPKRKNPVVAETPVVLDHTLKKEDAKAFLMEKLELRERLYWTSNIGRLFSKSVHKCVLI